MCFLQPVAITNKTATATVSNKTGSKNDGAESASDVSISNNRKWNYKLAV